MTARPSPLDPEMLLRQTSWLQALARGLAGDAQHAEDLVQETWVRALERPPTVSDEGSLRGWLAKVLRNVSLSERRSAGRLRARERAAARPEAQPSTAESVERVALQRELVDAVLALDATDREVVVLRYFDGLPPREIAKRSGLTGSAVRSRLSRALDTLRKRLEPEDRRGTPAWVALLALPEGDPGAAAGPGALSGDAGWKLAATAVGVAAVSGTALLLAEQRQPETAAAHPATVAAVERESTPTRVPASAQPTRSGGRVPGPPVDAPDGSAEEIGANAAASWAISVRFRDSSGRPLEGVLLSVGGSAARGGDRVVSVKSEADGLARAELGWPFAGPTVGGGERVGLEASGPGYARHFWYVPIDGPGQQDLGDFHVLPGGDVIGRVVDETGKPVQSAHLRVRAAFDATDEAQLEEALAFGTNLMLPGESVGVWTYTDAEGHFRLEGVPSLPVTIDARATGHLAALSAHLEVGPGQTYDLGVLSLERPPPEGSIAGVVLDGDGRPVPGVEIRFAGPGSPQNLRHGTDAEGRFVIPVVSGRDYLLDFVRRDSHRDALRRAVSAGQTDLVVRFAHERWIVVRPTGPDGQTVPGARVWLVSKDGYGLHADRRDWEDGTIEVQVPDTEFLLGVDAPGWVADSVGPFEPSGVPDRLEVPLRRGFGLRGRVTAQGQPVAGARVDAHAPRQRSRAGRSDDGFHCRLEPMEWSQTETDANGEFFLQLSYPTTYTVHASAEGHARAELPDVDFVAGQDRLGIDLELPPGGTIEGRVLTAPDVSPKGTVVGAGRGDGHVLTQTVGEDGRYRFEHLTPGPWQVLLCDPDTLNRLEGRIYLNADPAQPVEWTLELGAGETARHDIDRSDRVPTSLYVEVRLDGTPQVGWFASLYGERRDTGLTDGQGRVGLNSPGPGRHRLWLAGGRGEPVRYAYHEALELSPGRNDRLLDLLTGTVTLEGVPVLIEDAEGKDAETPYYALLWREGGGHWTAEVDSWSGGDLRIEGVPVGRVEVFEDPEDLSLGIYDESWKPLAVVEVEPGGEHTVSLP